MQTLLCEIGPFVCRVMIGVALLLVCRTAQRQPRFWTKNPFPKQTLFAAPLSFQDSKQAVTPARGTVRENPKDRLKYVWIPPGTFRMGCSEEDRECTSDEQPPHQLTMTKGFWIGQTEVTVGAYKRFAQATEKPMPPEPAILGRPLNEGWKNDQQPMVNVSWYEAGDYCAWTGGRLPTDAEWEYAARGGNPKVRDEPLGEVAWYADNTGRERLDSSALKSEDLKTYGGGRRIFNQRLKDNGNGMQEVGRKKPNGYGLFDMLGNVWEWVDGWYDPDYYQNSPAHRAGSIGLFAGPRGTMFLLTSGSRTTIRIDRGSGITLSGFAVSGKHRSREGPVRRWQQ